MPEEYGGVIISFSHSGKQSNKITTKGARPCVEAVKKYIQEIIEDLDNEITTECVIPQKFHHFLMRPIYSRVKQITKDYNVQIKFSERFHLLIKSQLFQKIRKKGERALQEMLPFCQQNVTPY